MFGAPCSCAHAHCVWCLLVWCSRVHVLVLIMFVVSAQLFDVRVFGARCSMFVCSRVHVFMCVCWMFSMHCSVLIVHVFVFSVFVIRLLLLLRLLGSVFVTWR